MNDTVYPENEDWQGLDDGWHLRVFCIVEDCIVFPLNAFKEFDGRVSEQWIKIGDRRPMLYSAYLESKDWYRAASIAEMHRIGRRLARAELRDEMHKIGRIQVGTDTHFMGKRNLVTVVCDRCHQTVEGYEIVGYGTGGFYRTDGLDNGWGRFANPDEKIVCDTCMQSDPRYRAEYPLIAAGPHVPQDKLID